MLPLPFSFNSSSDKRLKQVLGCSLTGSDFEICLVFSHGRVLIDGLVLLVEDYLGHPGCLTGSWG